jgi:hypothetical protein
MKTKPIGDNRRLPTATLKRFAVLASAHVEAVRKKISVEREAWPDLCAIPGVNKRWLRAFMTSQIKQPPAAKFLAVVDCLVERSLSKLGK